jgi:predicted RNase H-like HicB family nuclease
MTRRFTAHLWREGNVWVAQCLEVDVASQGETEEEALANLKEALELFLEAATPSRIPDVRTVEVELGPAA